MKNVKEKRESVDPERVKHWTDRHSELCLETPRYDSAVGMMFAELEANLIQERVEALAYRAICEVMKPLVEAAKDEQERQ